MKPSLTFENYFCVPKRFKIVDEEVIPIVGFECHSLSRKNHGTVRLKFRPKELGSPRIRTCAIGLEARMQPFKRGHQIRTIYWSYFSGSSKTFGSLRDTPMAQTIGVPAWIRWPWTRMSRSWQTRAANGAVALMRRVSSRTCHVYLSEWKTMFSYE